MTEMGTAVTLSGSGSSSGPTPSAQLESVAGKSKKAARPSDWRLGDDPCFVKLAYWPESVSGNAVTQLTPGMYLPVSYVRMLLEDDCTRGVKADSQARILGYGRVERHLVGKQFVELASMSQARRTWLPYALEPVFELHVRFGSGGR